MKKKLQWIAIDIAAAALILLGVWIVNYKIPQKQTPIGSVASIGAADASATTVSGSALSGSALSASILPGSVLSSGASDLAQDGLAAVGLTSDGTALSGSTQVDAGTATTVSGSEAAVSGAGSWREKFKDHFTEQVVETDTSYTSPNLSVQLSYHQYDSGVLDETDTGNHVKYGTKISYVLADIYMADISCFQTAFAQDTYGVGFSEKLSAMSSRLNSILAVNGDSYSNNRHKDNGTIIRNGVIYRNKQSDAETCVLNQDGTIDIYAPGKIDLNQLVKKGAWQSWVFGPSLLDENGKAKTSFITWDYIRQSHPRTALGYYEPGHYCLLLVDGRQTASRGMFLDEMAAVFEQLGCKAAYNLDGGHCSFMTLQDQVVSHPYKPEHEVADGIFICEQ